MWEKRQRCVSWLRRGVESVDFYTTFPYIHAAPSLEYRIQLPTLYHYYQSQKKNYALITRDPAPSMLLRSGFNFANPRNGDSKSIYSSITLPIIVVLNIPNTFNSNMSIQVRGSRHPSRIRLARSRRLNRKSHLPH